MTQTFLQPAAGDSISTGRTKWNDCLDSLQSAFSGTSAPTGAVPGQLWLDTTNDILKIYREDSSGWIPLANSNEGIIQTMTGSYQFTDTAASGTYSGEHLIPLMVAPHDLTIKTANLISSKTTSGSGGSKKWFFSIHNATDAADISSADLDTDTAELTALAATAFSLDSGEVDIDAGDVVIGTLQATGSPTNMKHNTVLFQLEYYRKTA